MLAIFKNSFVIKLNDNFVWNMPPQLKCLPALPRDLSLITICISDCRHFSDTDISQDSVATYLVCGGICRYEFVANLSLSLRVIKCWKSVSIWESYGQQFSVLFFLTHGVLIPVAHCLQRDRSTQALRTVHTCAALVKTLLVFTSAAHQRAAQRMCERQNTLSLLFYSLRNSYSSTNKCTRKRIHQITNAHTWTVDTYRVGQKVIHFNTISLEPFKIKWCGFTAMFRHDVGILFRMPFLTQCLNILSKLD